MDNGVIMVASGEHKEIDVLGDAITNRHIEHLKTLAPPHSLDLTKPQK